MFLAVPDEIRLQLGALAAYRRAAGRTAMTRPWCKRPASWLPRDRQGPPDALLPTLFPSLYPVGSRSRQGPDERAGALVHSTPAGRRAAGASPSRAAVGRTISGGPTLERLIQTDRGRGRDVEVSAPLDVRGGPPPRSRPTTRVLSARTAMPSHRQASASSRAISSTAVASTQSGRSQVGDGDTDIGRDDDRDREDATGGRAQTLPGWVDAALARITAAAPMGVGEVDYRACVARPCGSRRRSPRSAE